MAMEGYHLDKRSFAICGRYVKGEIDLAQTAVVPSHGSFRNATHEPDLGSPGPRNAIS